MVIPGPPPSTMTLQRLLTTKIVKETIDREKVGDRASEERRTRARIPLVISERLVMRSSSALAECIIRNFRQLNVPSVIDASLSMISVDI
jgi:hypothetical protein